MTDINVDPAVPVEPAAVTPPVVEPTPTPPATPATPPAPWAADLATAFTDEAERARVDSFMREKYQPYVTGLETKHAPAAKLYADLQGEDSLESYLSLAEQLYGEETANLLAEAIVAKYSDDPTPPADPATTPPVDDVIPFDKLPPEVQADHRERQAEKEQKHYWSEMERVKAAFVEPPAADGTAGASKVNQDLFHPFVVGAAGDFDSALEAYKVWHAQAYPAAPAPVVPAPPATLPAGHAAPPVAKRYTSIDEAFDDTFAEMRAKRNPPPTAVGSA